MGEAPPSRERRGPAWLVHTIMDGNARETGLDMVHEKVVVGREERRPEMSFLAYQHGTWEATLGQH